MKKFIEESRAYKKAFTGGIFDMYKPSVRDIRFSVSNRLDLVKSSK